MRFILFALLVSLSLALNAPEILAGGEISVMFAQNHKESYDLEGRDLLSLQKFASFLAEQDVNVYSMGRGRLDRERLRGIDVLIISYPQENITDEIAEVIEYVEAGGGLLVLGGQQCRDYINPLLEEFGMEMKYELIERNGQIDFIFNASEHALFAFVRNFEYLHAPPVRVGDPAWIAYRPEWLGEDLSLLATRKYGRGKVIVSGDADFLNNFYLERYDNAQLGLNLVYTAAGREPVVRRRGREFYPIFVVLFVALILALLALKRFMRARPCALPSNTRGHRGIVPELPRGPSL